MAAWARTLIPTYEAMSFSWDGTHHRFSLDKQLNRKITSKTEAQAEADRLRSEIRAGRFGSNLPARDTLTVRQLLDEYGRAYLTPRHGKVRDADRYQIDSLARVVLRLPTGASRAFGQWKVLDVSAAALEQYRTVRQAPETIKREGRGARRLGGPVAVNRTLGYLRAVFNWAIRAGHVCWRRPRSSGAPRPS